ncbi:MAG: glutathione S-transferase family protein [Brachymonas sp.]|nr:glutathione S-transferase family protein [Brachymonas sp.]
MTIQLYFSPGACSFVPHVLLEMAGASFEPTMVKLHKGEQYGDEYKAINPRSQVPVLVANGQALTQIVAICGYIAAQFPAANFMPQSAWAQAKMLETFAWMNNTVHPTFTHIFMPQKFSEDAAAQASMKAFHIPQMAARLAEIDALIGQAKAKGGQFIAAPWGHDHFTALDAYTLTLTRWGSIAGIDPTQFTQAWAHIQQIAVLPAMARVIERERLQLNLMAKT